MSRRRTRPVLIGVACIVGLAGGVAAVRAAVDVRAGLAWASLQSGALGEVVRANAAEHPPLVSGGRRDGDALDALIEAESRARRARRESHELSRVLGTADRSATAVRGVADLVEPIVRSLSEAAGCSMQLGGDAVEGVLQLRTAADKADRNLGDLFSCAADDACARGDLKYLADVILGRLLVAAYFLGGGGLAQWDRACGEMHDAAAATRILVRGELTRERAVQAARVREAWQSLLGRLRIDARLVERGCASWTLYVTTVPMLDVCSPYQEKAADLLRGARWLWSWKQARLGALEGLRRDGLGLSRLTVEASDWRRVQEDLLIASREAGDPIAAVYAGGWSQLLPLWKSAESTALLAQLACGIVAEYGPVGYLPDIQPDLPTDPHSLTRVNYMPGTLWADGADRVDDGGFDGGAVDDYVREGIDVVWRIGPVPGSGTK